MHARGRRAWERGLAGRREGCRTKRCQERRRSPGNRRSVAGRPRLVNAASPAPRARPAALRAPCPGRGPGAAGWGLAGAGGEPSGGIERTGARRPGGRGGRSAQEPAGAEHCGAGLHTIIYLLSPIPRHPAQRRQGYPQILRPTSAINLRPRMGDGRVGTAERGQEVVRRVGDAGGAIESGGDDRVVERARARPSAPNRVSKWPHGWSLTSDGTSWPTQTSGRSGNARKKAWRTAASLTGFLEPTATRRGAGSAMILYKLFPPGWGGCFCVWAMVASELWELCAL